MERRWFYLLWLIGISVCLQATAQVPPTITESTPSKYRQLQGATIRLYCKVDGTPDPVGIWTKDNQELKPSARVTISDDNTEVEIRDLQRSDGGTYSCRFSNTIGFIAQTIDLIVEGAAYILSAPSNTTAVQGQRVSLYCGADAFPNNITYRWYFNDRNVNTYPGYGQRMYIQADGTFIISAVIKEDMGWYICRPSNGVGQDPEAAAFLNVTYLPRILSMPSRVTWALGFSERLDCLVDANPPVKEITWTKDNKVVQFILDVITQLPNGSLFVFNASKRDEGSYSCLPVSSVGHGPTSPLVQVVVRDPPHFTLKPQEIYIRKPGESIKIPCSATGSPPPSITWRKVSGRMDFGSRAQVDETGTLTIIDIEKQDHGTYECEASNDFTRIVTSTNLIIESTTPHAPYNVTVIPSWFDASVSWIPAYNGGSPQTFLVWYRSVNGEVSQWITMRVENATNLKVFRLEPDTLYEFKVLSRNMYGEGNFSAVKLVRTLGNHSSASRRANDGEAAGIPTALPTEPSGQTYIPVITRTFGPRPDSPRNLTAVYENGGIRISWFPPANVTPKIFYYVIEKTTSSNWMPLDDEVKADYTSYFIKDGIIPSTTYRFRVYAYTATSYSLPSDMAVVTTPDELFKPATVAEESKGVFLSEAEIGGIVGGLLFLLVAVLLAIIGIICSRKKDRSRGDKYGNVKYMGPADDVDRTTVPQRMEDSSKWSRSLSNSRADTVRGYEVGSGVFIVPKANQELYRQDDLRPENYLWDGKQFNPSSYIYNDKNRTHSRSNNDRFRHFDNVDSFESGWYPESHRDQSNVGNQSYNHSLIRPRSTSRSPYTSHGFADPNVDFVPMKERSYQENVIDDSDSDDNGFLPLRPPLPVGYDPTPIRRFPDFDIRNNSRNSRSYARDHPSYDDSDDVFSPNIPHTTKSGFPRHSSMKPSSTQTYLTDDPISFSIPYNEISSVHQSPEHIYQNVPYRPWNSFPPYYSRDVPMFDDNRLSHSAGYSPQKQVARVSPNQKNNSPRDEPLRQYTRDHLQGTVDKLRRGPRYRRSRSASRNSAPEFDTSDKFHNGYRNAYNSDSDAMRPSNFDRHGRPYSYDSDPTSSFGRYNGKGRYPEIRSFRDDPTPDSLSSGIWSKNTTGSNSVPRNSLSYSSLLTPQDHDYSHDLHDHSLHRDTSADENYEFDTPDFDTILAYPGLSGGDELLSAIESGLSTSDFYNDLYPKPSKQSKYEDSEQRFEKLRREYHQFQRQQQEQLYHTQYIDSEML